MSVIRSMDHDAQYDVEGGGVSASELMTRICKEIATLVSTAEELQRAFHRSYDSAAVAHVTIMPRAQELDFIIQSMRSLVIFLKTFEGRRVGQEALDIEAAARVLPLASLGERLAGLKS